MVRTLYLGVAALSIAASSAGAQITTYIAPPRQTAQERELIATADSARRDSVARATMANMTAWVDSAAGVPVPPTVGAVDTAALANDPGRPVTTFSDGAVAPATASSLPTLVVIGAVAFAIGAALLAMRSRG